MPLTTAQRKEIRESFTSFGLSLAEQDTYLALLESGPRSASPIAHALHTPLTTTQSVLRRLAKKGIIRVTKQKSRGIYEAEDPQIFTQLLRQHLEDAAGITPLLKTIQGNVSGETHLRVYTNERVTDIFRQALTAKKKLVYEIVSARELQESLGERFHFTKRRVAQGVYLKSLRVEANEIKKYNQRIHARELREARFLPRELTFHSSILFWDNNIAFLTPPTEGLAWIVESPSLAQTMKQLFELLWSVSHKMETAPERS